MSIKTKKNYNKSKSKSNKKTSHKGGLFNVKPKEYSNVTYKDSSFVMKKLTCPSKGCNGTIFKHRELKLGTKWKSFLLDTDFFDNKYNSFTCTKCGYVQFYSGRIKYDAEEIKEK
jgi:predicted nucleic-acid-binding Zn-ribbon protein